MRVSFYVLIALALSCTQSNKESSNQQEEISSYKIAFGSCSVQGKTEAQLWTEVEANNPDLWIWLGDNVYADTEDMAKMKADYDLQKSHSDYQSLIATTDVIGIWDDHDFGGNDMGKEYPMKDESRDLLFNFLDVPKANPAWKRKGAYQAYEYQVDSKKFKIILLDARFFRDSLKWTFDPKTAQINEEGTILGEEQWQWFEQQISDATVDLFIVGSGIQVLTENHRFEKWANFPKERKRMLDLITEKVEVPLLFLSGDRHISEVSKLDLEGYNFPLYDLTSSSLTNPWGEESPEANDLRVGNITYPANFAVMDVKWSGELPSISLKFVGQNNEELQAFSIDY